MYNQISDGRPFATGYRGTGVFPVNADTVMLHSKTDQRERERGAGRGAGRRFSAKPVAIWRKERWHVNPAMS